MAKKGKKYTDTLKRFDFEAFHGPAEAIELVRTLATAKFDETVELVVRLGVDPRKADQVVRGTVGLPSGTGTDVRVAVFAAGEAANEARAAGADLVGADDLGATLPTGPSVMVSLMDFRQMADADASRLGIYLDNLSHGDVNTWVIRHPDRTTVTVSFPDTQEARHSVHHFIGVLRSTFTDAAELTTGWIDEIADQSFAHTA